MDYMNNSKMKIIYGDVVLGLKGKDFHYIFSYQTGGLESMVINDREWIYRTPKPTFWRATTDNDRGNGFSIESGQWMSADIFQKCKDIRLSVDKQEINGFMAPLNNCFSNQEYAKNISIQFVYETITVPKTEILVKYDVDFSGRIEVNVTFIGKKDLPELPLFGMKFIMPTCATKYVYQGLSGETYPDRMMGAKQGIYQVMGLPVTLYIVPQDCGMHVESDWVEVYRNKVLDNRNTEIEETKIPFTAMNQKIGFSCLPYTAEELENATHQEELPAPRRTVLCICGAVRGVGGIDSWGSNVEEQYRIRADKDIHFSFVIDF